MHALIPSQNHQGQLNSSFNMRKTNACFSLLLCLSISSLLSPPCTATTPSSTIHITTNQPILSPPCNQPFATQGCDSTLETPVSAPLPELFPENFPIVVVPPTPELVPEASPVVVAPPAPELVPDTSPVVVSPPTPELVPDTSPVVVTPPAPELVPETSPVVVSPPAPDLVPETSPVVVSPPAPELVPETSPVVNAPPSPGLFGGSGSPLSSNGGSNGGVGLPFGKPVQGGGLSSVNGPVGLGGGQGLGQPLVDNTPYDSGCWIGKESWFGVGGLALALLFHALFSVHGSLF